MRLLVTRPRREATQWVTELQALGCSAMALPLIQVGPIPDTRAVQACWAHLEDYAAVMFVSANAVRYFFAEIPALARIFKGDDAIKTRAWATGPGTGRALLAAGVHEALLDLPGAAAGQFDSEALWSVAGHRIAPGDRVLIVRGREGPEGSHSDPGVGRDWLAQRVQQAGALAEFVVAYERGMPDLSVDERKLAQQAASDGSVWLFSSTEAILHLGHALPGIGWAQARAVATHPRIAAAARALGFAQVRESRPALAEVLASIESWR